MSDRFSNEKFTERFFEALTKEEKAEIVRIDDKDGELYLHFNGIAFTRNDHDQFTIALSYNGVPLVTYGGDRVLRRGDSYMLTISSGMMIINISQA